MEVVLTGRLVLLNQEATTEAAPPNNKAEEEEKKLAAASHEDTKPPGLGDDAKTAATPAEQPKDAAAGPQEEAATQDVVAGAEAAMVVDEKKGGAKYRWEGKWYFRGNKNKSSTFSYQVSCSKAWEDLGWLQCQGKRGGRGISRHACSSHLQSAAFILSSRLEGLASMQAISF